MTLTVSPTGIVRCAATLELPLSPSAAWGQLRDFHRYACQDFFHAGLTVSPDGQLQILHRFLGFTSRRVGRICWWREGVGYAFSDLSPRGPARGFPHVFTLRIEPSRTPEAADSCLLHLSVRGKWTAHRLPRPLVRLWLGWVFSKIVLNTEADLLRAARVQPCQSAAARLARRARTKFKPRRTARARPV